MGKSGKIDLHCHTIHSTDGEYSMKVLLERAKKNNLDYFSLTDHNNMSYILDYLHKKNLRTTDAYHYVDEVKYIPGVEVTCRINDRNAQNKKGNASKIHLLVYSPVIQREDLFYQMMDLKRTNDISYDFGPLIQIAKLKDVPLDEKEVRKFIRKQRDVESGFSSFGRNATFEFFDENYKGLFKSKKEFEELYDEINSSARLNLDARDVINFAHNAGAICIMAHPRPSMDRMIRPDRSLDVLVDYGVDGFEMFYPSMNSKSAELIEKTIKRHNNKNSMIYTGGSDFHRVVGWRDLGEFQDVNTGIRQYIQLKDANNFKKEIERLNDARHEKVLTHRRYEGENYEKLAKKLNKIDTFVAENKCIEGEFPIYNQKKDYSIDEFDKELLDS